MDIINVAFAYAMADGTVSANGTSVFNLYNNYIKTKARQNGCYVVLSLAPSSSWTTVANPENDLIDTLATNIVNTINTYGFDGIDIDWEYPRSGQYTWFTSLMQAIYTKVKANNPHHLVTAAIGGGKWQPAYYDLNNSKQYLDYINMMCYDAEKTNGHYQNALYRRSSYLDPTNKVGANIQSCCIDESVAIFNNTYGISNSKLIIGIPFYGVKQVLEDDAWVNSGSAVVYSTLKSYVADTVNYTYVFDDVAKVPYLLSTDGQTFISFEDPTSIGYKSQYIIDNNLAGMMVWQNGLDTTGDLINAIKLGLNK